MNRYLMQKWQTMTIHKKIMIFTSVVFIIFFVSVILNIWVIKLSLVDLNGILEDNSRGIQLIQALETEKEYFEEYVQRRGVTLEQLQKAMTQSEEAVQELPFDYARIGEQRYARTWSVRSGYQVYQEKRDQFLETGRDDGNYITKLYELYEMQDYLLVYAHNLMSDTLESGSAVYQQKIPLLIYMPVIIVVFGVLLLLVMMKLSRLMNQTIIRPVMQLADASKRIAGNDFFIEDVSAENQDEIGELVHAFNKMKYATGEYIMALEERRETMDLLHQEELEKLKTKNRMESMQLELLKSQVNPHFLFNTLNVISGMANLENAETTEKMIKALSSLFRYNLKTADTEVPLERELKVAEDYMYLQEMRFGKRISYDVVCEADASRVVVPAFTFQPLLENAIIHGLAGKEEGGRIRIRIQERDNMLYIYIGDTGSGMDEDALTALYERLENKEDTRATGIGLGNIYRRVKTMYRDGVMELYSGKEKGFVVKIVVPQGDRRAYFERKTD